MAKKTAPPTTPATPSPTPSRRRAPASGRGTTTRRAERPGEVDSAPGPTPTAEEIAEAAYRRYLERGGGHGSDFDDWLEAERSLRKR